MKKFLIYLIRWQMSTPILALCLSKLNFSVGINTIIANLFGGIIFYFIDKRIFKERKDDERTGKRGNSIF